MRKNHFAGGHFNLFGEALLVQIEKCVVSLVGIAANRVADDDHPVAAVHGTEHRGKNAKYRFRHRS